MPDNVVLIVAVLAALEVKHTIFDFFLQTPYQFKNKGIYGHPGGLLHAGLHAVGSIPAILIAPPAFWIAALIVIAEFVLHYHIDWSKEQLERRFTVSPNGARHFQILGTDQLAHQLTYIAIAATLASLASQ